VALRRRVQAAGGRPCYTHAGLRIDLVRREVSRDGVALHLSPKEYALLEQLALHAGKVLTHKYLLAKVWPNSEEADAQYLRVYLRQLRSKLGDSVTHPRWLLTEAGVGYRLVEGSSV